MPSSSSCQQTQPVASSYTIHGHTLDVVDSAIYL